MTNARQYEGKHLCIFHMPTEKVDASSAELQSSTLLSLIQEWNEEEGTEAFTMPAMQCGEVNFGYLTFKSAIDFQEATFRGDALFYEATFRGDAVFHQATFRGDTVFHQATFSGGAQFGEATFSGDAQFNRKAKISGACPRAG